VGIWDFSSENPLSSLEVLQGSTTRYCYDMVVKGKRAREHGLIERVIAPAHYSKQMFTANTAAHKEISKWPSVLQIARRGEES
jgi:hypothetical protein